MSGSSSCRTCHRPIVWARSVPNGKNIPLDPDPTPRGNLVLKTIGIDAKGGVLFDAFVIDEADRALYATLYQSHFVTCPYADQHRHRRRSR